ncbi:hypothetical protein, conserved [Babesia ovata]|uniref:C3H1-type domain-containing protein n=1 Tax=Babesia ovata TaxID=189622 RepID=A0A2H6KJP0_9APIC|nr:uncharacterized protein BOVATA_047070 [Babesia ovata]GBE63214.1 hypothetical protein, conserved [Babesia ovata]
MSKYYGNTKAGKDVQNKIKEVDIKGYKILHQTRDSEGKDFSDKTFTDQFENCEQQLDHFTQAVQKLVKKSNQTNTVDAYLTDLNSMISTSIEKVGFTSDITDKTTRGLLKIKEELVTLESRDVGGAKQTIDSILTKIKKLEDAAKFVEDMGVKAEERMKQLKNELQIKLDIVGGNISYADTLIQNATKAVRTTLNAAFDVTHDNLLRLKVFLINTVTDAFQKSETAVDKLQKTLITKVEDAFHIVTTEVRMLFSESRGADLLALKALVERQLFTVVSIIHDDLTTGVKGLLNNIDTYLVHGGAPYIFQNLKDFKVVSRDLKTFLDALLSYTTEQVRTPSKTKKGEKEDSDESKKVAEIQRAVDKLLSHLSNPDKLYNFDYDFQLKLSALTDAVQALHAEKFAGHQNPELLDALKKGMLGVTGELGHAYVNAYDGRKFTENLVDAKYELTPSNNTTIITLRDYGEKCSKVCATVFFILFRDMKNLKIGCGDKWTSNTTYSASGLGTFLKKSGYKVSKYENGHEGELRNKPDFKADKIYDLLIHEHTPVPSGDKFRLLDDYDDLDDENSVKHYSVLKRLYNHLESFYRVSHLNIPPKPRAPSSIYQMLTWCSGLRYNYVFDNLCLYLMELFGKPEGYKDSKYSDIPSALLQLDAHPHTITYDSLIPLLKKVCQNARKPLIAVLGYGHADGVYAVDHFNNSSNLSYPSSAAVCFDMLLDILQRLYQQLYFVLTQCLRGKSTSGWRDCHYGRHVGGSSWRCNYLQCADQTCNQKHNQAVKQTANQHSDCGLKSPFQSFLEDGLQGFLSHSITSPGCKLTCSVTNHRGIPCKTPMGFGEISTMASQTQKGERLMRVLRDLCGDSEKPLSKLCGYLVCLTHRAPQTLGDMFAFYQGFITDYTGGFYGNKQSPVHTKGALKDAVTEAYFGQEHPFDPSPLFGMVGHVDSDIKGDLYSISTCTSDSVNSCGLFVQPLTLNIYRIFSSKHKSNYLSWIVYLTETFYDLLKKLFDECDAKCGAKGSNCHNKCCVKKCPVSSKTSTPCNHDSECRSIVKCQNTLPTLYRHGFTYGNAESLNGEYGAGKKRTCKDFCKALKNVLNEDKNVEAPLAKLIYVTIPDFLWKIREPFSLTLLALWSLSLLYLLHIAVVRLDVLRIRSHLRSPSSHRIAAQSLLAAARVKALANVKYFSP